jgi:copper(I)-binding protein
MVDLVDRPCRPVNKESPMNRRSVLALACGATLVLAACGSDSEGADATAAPAASSAASTGDTAAATDAITIEGAWARNSPAMATAGAAYFTVTSAVDDMLLGASVDASVAAKVELHEVVMSDMGTDTTMGGMASDTTMGGMASDTTMGGMASDTTMAGTGDTMAPTMEMRPVEAIELPAGEAVALAPGGYHVMLLDLAAPLEIGQTFTLTLTFEKAGTRDVEVTVADEAP